MKTKDIKPLKGKRLLVAVTGSIAAVKTPLLVSKLIKAGAEVKCVITPSAAKLISPISLGCLSRNKCYQESDQWSQKEPRPLHISLADWADLIIVAPLSATTLGKWSQGIAEGLLASILIAFEKPIIAAAAMNTGMWSNNAVQKNWQFIKSYPNVIGLSPASGLLACDRTGEGRMITNSLIEIAIESAFIQMNSQGIIKKDWKGLKLLATSGPTEENLDAARLLTNRSSGKMGVLLAQAAKLRGAEVDLIHGPLRLPEGWLEGLNTYEIKSASEMQSELSKLQHDADAIAMAAAVGDLRHQGKLQTEKLKKDELVETIKKNLVKVPDLLAEIASKKPDRQVILGFSALTGEDLNIQQLGEAKRSSKNCDLLFANPIDRSDQGFEVDTNGGWLIGKKGMVTAMPVTTKLELAHKLLDALINIHRENHDIGQGGSLS